MRKNIVTAVAVVAAFSCGVAFAQGKMKGARHPNLAAAMRECHQAVMHITKAQEANEFDMEGHAAKAKDLLTQAETEIKAAAGAANENKK